MRFERLVIKMLRQIIRMIYVSQFGHISLNHIHNTIFEANDFLEDEDGQS